MPEVMVARRILELVLARADGAGAGRVRRVRGRVAEVTPLSYERLARQFDVHARGTLAEGAEIDIDILRVDARCRGCGERFEPKPPALRCPLCGGVEISALGRTGIAVDLLEVDP